MGELSNTTINGVSYDFKDAGAARQSHSHTKSQITDFPTSMPASDVPAWAKASSKPSYTASEVGAIATTAKGAASGVAELDANGKVPSSQLPSFVDDVLEYSAKSSFPTTGETGKIYVDTTTNLTYRWSGTAYVEISPSLALGTTSSTAYYGDKGKTAYDHSQITSGNPHNVTKTDVGLGNVGNFKAVSTVASQGLSDTEKSNARANIGAGTSSLALGTSSSTAYRGDYGNTAYSHATDSSRLTTATESGLYKVASTAQGHIASLSAVAKADITALGIPAQDTTYGVVSTSGNGLAPKVTDTSKFLKGDGTWATPANTWTAMVGATSSANGSVGYVNATPPKDGYNTKYLRADGSWQIPPNTTYSAATTSAAGLMSATDKTKLDGIASGATAVSETTVSGWGFTKNTGTYSKPLTGIPKTDLASAVQTSLGKADSALQSHQTIKQDGVTGATVNRFGTCSTNDNVAAKTVSITNGTFSLEAGARVTVKFMKINIASSPTLNVNSTGAKNIFHRGAQITTSSNKCLLAGTVDFIYDGTQYHLIGNYVDYTHPTDGTNTGSFGPSASVSPGFGGTFSVPYVTVNDKGHVTAASTKTITMPAFTATPYTKPTKHSNITSIDSGGYIQIGKLVIVNMRFTVGTECGQYTDLFTDLPLPLTPLSGGSACVACASNNNILMICANGRMQNYDSGSLAAGVYVVSTVYIGQ